MKFCVRWRMQYRPLVSLLRQGGKAAFVHRSGRLIDIITLMRNYGLEPKRVQFVYPKAGKEANTLLIEGIKGWKTRFKNFTSACCLSRR